MRPARPARHLPAPGQARSISSPHVPWTCALVLLASSMAGCAGSPAPLPEPEESGPSPLEEAASLLHGGRGEEALALLEELSARSPDDGEIQAHKARALLHMGFGEPARWAARRSVELAEEPENLLTEAWVLEHDLVGRRHAPGWDREGAVAAYRAAASREPECGEIHSMLAGALMVPEPGIFALSPRVDEAVETCLEAWERVDDVSPMVGACVDAVASSGRWELAGVLASRDEGALTRSLWFAERVFSSPPEVAQALIALANKNARAAVPIITGTFELLLRHRAYEAFFRLSEALATVAGESTEEMQALADFRRFEEIELDPEDPALVPARLLQAIHTDSTEVDPTALLSRYALRADGGELALLGFELVWEMVFDMLGDGLASLGGGMPRVVHVDSALALAEFSADGDPELGWRIRFRPSEGSWMPISFYVVQEEGELRFLGATWAPAPVADQAIADARSGRLRAARTWLLRAQDFAKTTPPESLGEGFELFAKMGDVDEMSADELLLAAAGLGAQFGGSEAMLEVLEEAAAAEDDPEEKSEIEFLLLEVLEALDDREAYLRMAERFHEARPEDPRARAHLHSALDRAGEHERLLEALTDVLGDEDAEEGPSPRTAWFLMKLGLLEEAQEVFRRTEDPTHENNLLWISLFMDDDSVERVEKARRLQSRPGLSRAAYHTVVAALAEHGETAEASDAYRTYLQRYSVGRELEESDWYLVGRMAEHYDLREAAASAYRRLSPPEEQDAAATYHLARRRLDMLEAKTD